MRVKVRALANMPRLTAAFALFGLLVAAAVGYAFFVGGQKQYLESRNFRLLRSLASQLESAIGNEARVIESLAREDSENTWKYFRNRRYRGYDLPDRLPRLCKPDATYALTAGASDFFVEIEIASDDPDPVEARSGCPKRDPVSLKLPFARIVEPIVKPKLAQGAFDTIAVATQQGVTWFAAGERATELQSTRLEAFIRPAGSDAPRQKLADVVHSTVIDLTIGGVQYQLFAQPCCGGAGNPSMMVVGLVEADVLRARSWAISTTVVKLVVIAILVALVAWPFLKLKLLGERQRVRAFDVLQVAISSVAALALLAMTVLDTVAYRRLNADRDAQLAVLAHAIGGNVEDEIRQALDQIACLERIIGTESEANMLGRPDGCAGGRTSADWPYPWFESFSLIDRSGMQRVKLSTLPWIQSRIPVGSRRYFTDIIEGKAWQGGARCRGGCALESVWSWTSGEPQAVLSRKPALSHGQLAPAEGENGYAVAALSIPMRSVMRPVLPPGFQFAVIDGAGTVLFHSDRHRNGLENFFSETDDNRRLRAQVIAHSSEPLDLRYWGAPYRAYVRPLKSFNLSIITLFEKDQAWALNREWLVVALLLLAGHLALCLGVLIVGLAWDASWVWPDPARHRGYVFLAIVYVLLLGLFAVICARGQGTPLVWAGYLLPIASWVATFAVLLRRPAPAAGGATREPVLAHAVTFGLLLIVTGVVPGVLLFLASFQLHVQSYLKHSDFRVERALGERERRLDQEWSKARGAGREIARKRMRDDEDVDLYYAFFYDTRIERGGAAREASACAEDSASDPHDAPHAGDPQAAHGHGGDAGDLWLGLLEGWLPYYAESSVEWRELLHEHAGDRSWRSRVLAGDVLALTMCGQDAAVVTLTSQLPSLLGPGGRTRAGVPVERAAIVDIGSRGLSLLAVLALACGLLALSYRMVRFMARQVFLVGIADPFAQPARRAAAGMNGTSGHDTRSASAEAHDATVTGALRGWPAHVWQQFRGLKRSSIEHLLAAEGAAHPQVRSTCERIWHSCAVQQGELSREQVIEEIAEQAAPVYRRIWSGCTEDEKLLLAHLATDGWANASSRAVVRRLLGRRLLRKNPDLRLMNESFRAFVLSPVCEPDVRRLESATALSAWDHLRVPFGVLVIGVSMFLFVTQKELYNAILGVTTTAAVSVPTLVRALGMLAGRRGGADEGAAPKPA